MSLAQLLTPLKQNKMIIEQTQFPFGGNDSNQNKANVLGILIFACLTGLSIYIAYNRFSIKKENLFNDK